MKIVMNFWEKVSALCFAQSTGNKCIMFSYTDVFCLHVFHDVIGYH